MKATVKYVMVYKASDLFPKHKDGSSVRGWVICKKVVDEHNRQISAEDVACFNFDSEATLFQRFLHQGSTVTVDSALQELFEGEDRLRAKNR